VNEYEEVILAEIKKNGSIGVKGLRRIVCDDEKYQNRMGTPTLEKYLKRLHKDGYLCVRPIKNQKLYSIIGENGFNHEKFIDTLNSAYNKVEKGTNDALQRVENDTYDKKLHLYYNVINLFCAYQNFLKILNLMTKNKLNSNSYQEIERKFDKSLQKVIKKIDHNSVLLIIKNFEKDLREPSEQIDSYLFTSSKKKRSSRPSKANN